MAAIENEELEFTVLALSVTSVFNISWQHFISISFIYVVQLCKEDCTSSPSYRGDSCYCETMQKITKEQALIRGYMVYSSIIIC